MFRSLTNLTKAVVSLAASPIAIAADLLTLPASSMDPYRGPFDKTAGVLRNAGDCFREATKPETK